MHIWQNELIVEIFKEEKAKFIQQVAFCLASRSKFKKIGTQFSSPWNNFVFPEKFSVVHQGKIKNNEREHLSNSIEKYEKIIQLY